MAMLPSRQLLGDGTRGVLVWSLIGHLVIDLPTDLRWKSFFRFSGVSGCGDCD